MIKKKNWKPFKIETYEDFVKYHLGMYKKDEISEDVTEEQVEKYHVSRDKNKELIEEYNNCTQIFRRDISHILN